MRKFLAGLFAAGLLLSAAPSLDASQGVRPERTTYTELAKHADLIVKAKLVEVRDVKLSEDEMPSVDAQMHRHNNNDESIRRDAVLQVSEVLSGEMAIGELHVVSLEQRSFTQYPEALQNGEEGLFFLEPGLGENADRWEIGGGYRGILTSEDADGDFSRVLNAVEDVLRIEHRFIIDEDGRLGHLQERLMSEVKLDGSRLCLDALIEFGWKGDTYKPYFDTFERAKLVDWLYQSEAGSDERLELITAISRVQPEGGQEAIIEAVVSDASQRTAARASHALEQYGTAQSCELLLDRSLELMPTETTAKARIITTLGILRPYNKHADEQMARARFTDMLRQELRADNDELVLQEALLAARDMRYTANELGPELTRLIDGYRAGVVGETVYKRVIVALAATRSAQANEQLESLKGEFDGRFDKHIELCQLTPFTVLVDLK